MDLLQQLILGSFFIAAPLLDMSYILIGD